MSSPRKARGRDSRVGILLAHSPETIVSVLGVLKSGAAYVPLDPEHPAGRIGPMLDDAGVQIVVTTEALAHLAGDRDVVRLDADAAWLAAAPSARPAGRATPGDPAYVIYTSGSTGTPKGVAISHRSLVNYVWWARSVYLNGEATDAALHSSLAFDLTVTSIFAPLVTGGAVVSYQGREGEPAILDVLADDTVGLIKLTPSHLALVADERSLPSRLRAFIVGGENLDTALARRVHERFGGRVAIFNEYGPTEATVGCMIHRFDPDRDHRAAVPIGGPAANARIYVLDGRLEPAAPGGVGQIYIGGDGLALGYLGQPELTADRFVADPFNRGARMYRTGDVARRLPDGPIEFLGRNDDQVKIRGHRIDLNEVRHAVVQHPGVRDAAVRRLDDPDGSGVIVAYCVSRQPIDAAELRAFVRERLVDAAVPAAFVFLRRLPLTLNGKVNYRALPGLDDIRRQAVRSSEPPRTPTEHALAAIWRQLLNLDRVGVHDNFFELGGHSLIATQVVSRVRDALGVELPLRSLFEQPTIAGLAARIDGTGVPSATPDAIARVRRDGALPLSFAQQRLWFLDQLEPGSPVYNIAATLGIDGPLDPAALGASFDAIVARHESLRTTFDDEDGRPRQRIAERLALDLPLVDLSMLEPDAQAIAVDRAAAEEAAAPFDLRRGPLVRARLLRLAPERHVLLFTLHHIIADGWSMGVLARELSAVYAARLAGRSADLGAVAGPIRGFRGVAAPCVDGRLSGARDRVLAIDARRRSGDRAADRAAAPAGADLPRRLAAHRALARPREPHARDGARARRDAVHGDARRVRGAAPSVDRAGRPRDRIARREPHPARYRRAHRLLRQYHRPAREARRPADVPRARRARESGVARRVRAPGPALRAAGRRAAAGARAQPQPDLPGDVRPASCGGALARPARPRVQPARRRDGHGEVRPQPAPRRGRRPHRGRPRIQHRPLRRVHDRAAAVASRDPAHRGARSPGRAR